MFAAALIIMTIQASSPFFFFKQLNVYITPILPPVDFN